MDWLSMTLGWVLHRTIVGGAVVVGMVYISHGQYVFAAAILLPLVAAVAWMAADLYDGGGFDMIDEWK